jgi:hypothetical protein
MAPHVRFIGLQIVRAGLQEQGTWHTLAEGRHEVTLDHADEPKNHA